MGLPYILTNSPATKPDADKFMANYYWLFAMLKGSFIFNGGMESWTAGTSFTNPANNTDVADSWKVEKGGTSAPSFSLERHAAVIDSGTYSMIITMNSAGSSNSYAKVKQSVVTPSRFSEATLTFGVKIKCSTANKVRISITDGVTTAYSQYHDGDGTWQKLVVSLTAAASPAEITVRVEVTGDFDGDTIFIDSAFLYAIEAAMSEAARATLEYFGPDQGGILSLTLLAASSILMIGQASAPTPQAGLIYFNSVDQQFYGCKDGSTWSILG